MVTLEDFVAETLIQIVRGCTRAQATLGNSATINPPVVKTVAGRISMRDGNIAQAPRKTVTSTTTHTVSFDVQITASSESQTKGDAGVRLHVFSAGTGGQSSSQNEHVNRVQFSIPIEYDASRTNDKAPVE